jgi:hypothetical protein
VDVGRGAGSGGGAGVSLLAGVWGGGRMDTPIELFQDVIS